MNCLVLDDDKNFSLKLKKDVEKFLDNIFSKYSIDIINENFNNIANYAKCNLIFVDIDLKESNGIDLVKKLQLLESNATIIYISSRQEFVFSSLSTTPFYFVRKQNYDGDIKDVFKLLKHYYEKTEKIITFDYYGRKTSIFLRDIHYIVSYGHDISIVTDNEVYTYRSTLKDIIEFIGSNIIVRVQKAYAVSLMFIKEVNGKNIILKDNTMIPMGKSYNKIFMIKYREYLIS